MKGHPSPGARGFAHPEPIGVTPLVMFSISCPCYNFSLTFEMLKYKNVNYFNYYFSFWCFHHHFHVILESFKPINSCQIIIDNDDNSLIDTVTVAWLYYPHVPISSRTQTLCTCEAQRLGILPYQILRVFWFTCKSMEPNLGGFGSNLSCNNVMKFFTHPSCTNKVIRMGKINENLFHCSAPLKHTVYLLRQFHSRILCRRPSCAQIATLFCFRHFVSARSRAKGTRLGCVLVFQRYCPDVKSSKLRISRSVHRT